MNCYRVFNGVANIGAGQVMLLSGAQIKSRLHSLELPKGYEFAAKDAKSKPPELKPAVVTSSAPLQFIAGEVISLPDLPRHLVGVLEPLDHPKSETDTDAADRVLAARNPAEHKRLSDVRRKAAAEAKKNKAKA